MTAPQTGPPGPQASPPAAALRLLAWLFPRQDRDELLGNLEEHFLRRAERDGLRAARGWFWRQVVGFLLRWPQFSGKEGNRPSSGNVPRRKARAQGYVMEGLMQDLRFGLRTLWKGKGFSLMIVLTLALAIGANTTIFSMVSALVLQPVPFSNSRNVAFLWMSHPDFNRPRIPLSLKEFNRMREQLTTFQDLAAILATHFNLRSEEGSSAVRLSGYRTTPNFFPLMGIELLRGRGFLPEEARSGQSHVAILSHSTWQSLFAGGEVLGREIFLDGVSHRIVGVLAPEVEVGPFQDVEIWLAMETDASGVEAERRGLLVAGRLQKGQTLTSAQQEAAAILARLEEENPDYLGWKIQVLSVSKTLLKSSARVALLILVLTVSSILLIACSNVANMVLARSLAREGEIALRSALGAGRLRILRQLLTENLILSILGAMAGVILAKWTLFLMVWMTRNRGPFVTFKLDQEVLLFALVLGVLTPLFFGLLPALRVVRKSLAGTLRERRVVGNAGRLIGRRTVVAAQVALSLMMLVIAGLATRSVSKTAQTELGFEPAGMLTFQVDRVPSDSTSEVLYSQMKSQLESLPGVQSVSITSHRPIVGGEPSQILRLPGSEARDSDSNRMVLSTEASSGHFSNLGVPVLQGREFFSTDSKRRLAVINEAARSEEWEGRDPLGSQFYLGADPNPWQVVGVVGNQRNPDAGQPPLPQIYLPIEQNPLNSFAVLVRSPLAPADLLPALRRKIAEMDPDLSISDARTLDEIVYDDQASDYAIIGLMSYLSIIALGLASAGIYAVTAFSANRRLHEFGVRLAMGALPRDLVQMIIRQSLVPVITGVGFGLLGAYWVAGIISGQLYGIAPTDPLTFGSVVGTLLFLALTATLLAAFRAVRTDLLRYLRA